MINKKMNEVVDLGETQNGQAFARLGPGTAERHKTNRRDQPPSRAWFLESKGNGPSQLAQQQNCY